MPVAHARAADASDAAIGARIRLRRHALGITQSDLAQALGLTFQQVQKYERGVNRVAANRILQIAKLLECSVSYLLGEPDDGPMVEDNGLVVALAEPGAVELLKGYAQLRSLEARRVILSTLRAFRHEEGGS